MATDITLDMVLAAFKKRGVQYKFYNGRDAVERLNRNAAYSNRTKDGFGPLRGLFIHNFASDISDASSNAYLARGDAGRDLPPPLSQFSIDDLGCVWLIGWGTANHASAGDSTVEAKARADAMPLDRDLKPSSTNPKILLAPFYLGVEMLYGAAPTLLQRKAVVLLAATLMELFGEGYTGGSTVMHRETHTTRSDPVGFKGYELRKEVNALLAAWKKGDVPVVTNPTPLQPSDKIAPAVANPDTRQMWQWDGIGAPYPSPAAGTNDFWSPASYLRELFLLVDKRTAELSKAVETLTAKVEALEAADTPPPTT